MNTEKAPRITQPTEKSVVVPNPELTPPPELPRPVLAGEVFVRVCGLRDFEGAGCALITVVPR